MKKNIIIPVVLFSLVFLFSSCSQDNKVISNPLSIEETAIIATGATNADVLVVPNELQLQELQEKQNFFSSLMTHIYTPEYQSLAKERSAISLAKEIWTKQIQVLDKKIKKIRMEAGSGAELGMNEEFIKLLKEKDVLMKSFYESTKYKEYIANNQSKLDSLDLKMKESWTPEMLELQQEIKVLQESMVTK